jgi:hypothetical protein
VVPTPRTRDHRVSDAIPTLIPNPPALAQGGFCYGRTAGYNVLPAAWEAPGSMRITFNILFILATLIGMIVASGGFVRRGITYDGVTSANDYWERMLRLWGTPVTDRGDVIDYVWVGRDHEAYFSVDKAGLATAYAPAVRTRIEELIKSVPPSDASQPGDYAAVDLQALTGQTFGNAPDRWQQWWDKNQSTFVPAPDGYDRLKSIRIAAERADYGTSFTALSLNRPWPPAWDYRHPWLRPLGRALAVLAGAIVARAILIRLLDKILRRRITAEIAAENR